MRRQVIVCEACGKTIAEGARRLTLSIHLTIVNGHEKHEVRHFNDLCGDQCAHEALTTLTRDVEAIR